jgi:type VI secretion system protein ImpF
MLDMADSTSARDRLQPSLLDRLIDDDPDSRVEAVDKMALTKQALRQAVLRDLGWLLNANGYSPGLDEKEHPHVTSSVVNYGLPVLSGQFSSSIEKTNMAQMLKQAIINFEPRILPKTLEIEVELEGYVMDSHNRAGLTIKGMLWAQPVPLEFLMRSRIDLEEGRFLIEEVSK